MGCQQMGVFNVGRRDKVNMVGMDELRYIVMISGIANISRSSIITIKISYEGNRSPV